MLTNRPTWLSPLIAGTVDVPTTDRLLALGVASLGPPLRATTVRGAARQLTGRQTGIAFLSALADWALRQSSTMELAGLTLVRIAAATDLDDDAMASLLRSAAPGLAPAPDEATDALGHALAASHRNLLHTMLLAAASSPEGWRDLLRAGSLLARAAPVRVPAVGSPEAWTCLVARLASRADVGDSTLARSLDGLRTPNNRVLVPLRTRREVAAQLDRWRIPTPQFPADDPSVQSYLVYDDDAGLPMALGSVRIEDLVVRIGRLWGPGGTAVPDGVTDDVLRHVADHLRDDGLVTR